MIKVGTKVHYDNDEGTKVNLIAIQKDTSTKEFSVWLCVNPSKEIEKDRCALYNCFEDDLEIGWK